MTMKKLVFLASCFIVTYGKTSKLGIDNSDGKARGERSTDELDAMFQMAKNWHIPVQPRSTLPPLDPLGGIYVHKGYREAGDSPADYIIDILKSKSRNDDSGITSDSEEDLVDFLNSKNEDDIKKYVVLSDTDRDFINLLENEKEKRGLSSLGGMRLHGMKRGISKRGLHQLGGMSLHGGYLKRALSRLGGMSLHGGFGKRGLTRLGGFSLHGGYKRGISRLGGMRLHGGFRKRGLSSLGGMSLHGGYLKRGLSSLGGMSLHGGFKKRESEDDNEYEKRGLSSLGGMQLHGFKRSNEGSLDEDELMDEELHDDNMLKRGLNRLGGFTLHGGFKRGLSSLGGFRLNGAFKRSGISDDDDLEIDEKRGLSSLGGFSLQQYKRGVNDDDQIIYGKQKRSVDDQRAAISNNVDETSDNKHIKSNKS